jgi:hypothetical protein
MKNNRFACRKNGRIKKCPILKAIHTYIAVEKYADGVPVREVIREYGLAQATIFTLYKKRGYRWVTLRP